MRRGAAGLTLILFMLCRGFADTVEAQPPANQAGFMESGKTATLDCAGGRAEIMGSSNVLAITGKCSRLDLAGSGNKIAVQFGPAAEINLVGSGNTIAWTSSDGKPPKMTTLGSGNKLTPPVQ